jgi:Na+-transporting methylmalonyl-CoA/oxaloacetate decarboxylase gamma subunit
MTIRMMLAILEGEASNTIGAGGLFLFLSVAVICVFTFISIAVWTEARRKEREAYYKAETVRRMTEMQGEGARAVIEMMREEERIWKQKAAANEVRKREGLKIGGLINLLIGVALYLFMRSIGGPEMVGAFPFAVGLALTVYAYVLAARQIPD